MPYRRIPDSVFRRKGYIWTGEAGGGEGGLLLFRMALTLKGSLRFKNEFLLSMGIERVFKNRVKHLLKLTV